MANNAGICLHTRRRMGRGARSGQVGGWVGGGRALQRPCPAHRRTCASARPEHVTRRGHRALKNAITSPCMLRLRASEYCAGLLSLELGLAASSRPQSSCSHGTSQHVLPNSLARNTYEKHDKARFWRIWHRLELLEELGKIWRANLAVRSGGPVHANTRIVACRERESGRGARASRSCV